MQKKHVETPYLLNMWFSGT